MNHPNYCECASCQTKRELLAKIKGTGKVHYGPTLPPVESNQTPITITPEALDNLKETAFEEGRAVAIAERDQLRAELAAAKAINAELLTFEESSSAWHRAYNWARNNGWPQSYTKHDENTIDSLIRWLAEQKAELAAAQMLALNRGSELAQRNRELAAAKERNDKVYCTYCSWETEYGEGVLDRIKAHHLECEHNPLVKELATAEAERLRLTSNCNCCGVEFICVSLKFGEHRSLICSQCTGHVDNAEENKLRYNDLVMELHKTQDELAAAKAERDEGIDQQESLKDAMTTALQNLDALRASHAKDIAAAKAEREKCADESVRIVAERGQEHCDFVNALRASHTQEIAAAEERVIRWVCDEWLLHTPAELSAAYRASKAQEGQG